MATDKPGSGERVKDQVHQETTTGEGDYFSRPDKDTKKNEGGRVISVGENKNHTSFKYNSSGELIDKKTRGDGGSAKDAKP